MENMILATEIYLIYCRETKLWHVVSNSETVDYIQSLDEALSNYPNARVI